MKKALSISATILIVIFAAYIVLMALFEGPIRIDLTDHVQLSVEDHTLKLPWYMSVGVTYDCQFDGTDMAGQEYTKFIYVLPEAFESSELDCVVCWETSTVIAFIGESRAMHVVECEFPTVDWS